MAFEGGPYLSAALLCEKVLAEAEGVKSAIRIIDRITRTAVGPEPPEQMKPFTHQLYFLVRLKSGSARGPKNLEIRLTKPSGESPPSARQTVNFEGEDDRGLDVVAEMQMELDQVGLYWFDVYLDNERLTRVPLRVVYLRQFTAKREQGGTSSQD
jgi:hypothetical protein